MLISRIDWCVGLIWLCPLLLRDSNPHCQLFPVENDITKSTKYETDTTQRGLNGVSKTTNQPTAFDMTNGCPFVSLTYTDGLGGRNYVFY